VKSRILRCSAALILAGAAGGAAGQGLTDVERLGKSIFFDEHLSINEDQACAACHDPRAGWTGPDSATNAAGAVFEGSIDGRFGNRKPPSAAYTTPSPILDYERGRRGEAVFFGGNFWNGKATGERLGNPAADQAQGPFLNPVEQALPDKACVVYRVCNPVEFDAYPVKFDHVWAPELCEITWPDHVDATCADEDGVVDLSEEHRERVDEAYDKIGLTVAAYEASPEVNQFSSKYDAYLAGDARLTGQERRGLRLFRRKAKCANCHTLDTGPEGEPPLFTDFSYHNLGVPPNPQNPWYDVPEKFNPHGEDWIDLGLGGFLETRTDYQQFADENYGKQKTPTVRNVAKRPVPGFVKAYMHNGYFKTLKQVVHFYNTRGVKPVCPELVTAEEAIEQGCWPDPEVSANLNTREVGDLRLSDAEEDAIVAFMRTLSDGYDDSGNDDDRPGRGGPGRGPGGMGRGGR